MRKDSEKSLSEQRRGEENNLIPFRRAPDEGPPGFDWLRTMPHEARFISKPRNYQGAWLNQYGIGMILPEAILLAKFDEGSLVWSWVDSTAFSKQNEFVAMIPQMKPEEEPEYTGRTTDNDRYD